MQNLTGFVYFIWFIVAVIVGVLGLIGFGALLGVIDDAKAKLYLAQKYDRQRGRRD